MIGVLLQKGRGTLDLRLFLYFQTQNAAHVNLIELGGCHFLSTIRNGMDIGVTLQKAEIAYKPIQANFLLQDCDPPLISAAVLQDKVTWL